MNFVTNRTNQFKEWWKRTPTKADRFLAAIIGAIGMFWVALISAAVLPISGPFTLIQILYWFLGFVSSGVIIGVIFPKIVTIVLFPFSLLGGGPN